MARKPDRLEISLFGLGYVGAVTAACLVRDGHRVIGVDVNRDKVELIKRGLPPVVEPGLADLLSAGTKAGDLSATTDSAYAVSATTMSLVCVGTPARTSGAPELSFVFKVCDEIGRAVAHKGERHVLVLRSTVPPGTLDRCREIADAAGAGKHLHFASNPEFLREGSAIRDYDAPPYTIIGTDSSWAEGSVRRMYSTVKGEVHVVAPRIAELVKIVANAWHAAKVTFANEVGRIARSCGLDGIAVMDLISRDRKLNTSAAYMKPGEPYGGACLPKDVAALLAQARERLVSVPMLEAVPASNRIHVELGAAEVKAWGHRNVAVFGLAFKPHTDDLRESPAVGLVKSLLGDGFRVRIFDSWVHQAALTGTNLAYLRQHLPHFEELMMPTAEDAASGAEVLVITQADPALHRSISRLAMGRPVIDLTHALVSATELVA